MFFCTSDEWFSVTFYQSDVFGSVAQVKYKLVTTLIHLLCEERNSCSLTAAADAG